MVKNPRISKYIMKSILLILSITVGFVFSVNAQTDIRKVDFKNFKYSILNLSGEKINKITVKNGKSQKKKKSFLVEVSGYGDLDGDGNEEAVIKTIENTGGAGNFSNAMIFTMKKGKPVVLTQFVGGDRGDGGIITAIIKDKMLIVEQNKLGETGGACCPEFVITTNYELKDSKLLQVGTQQTRKL
jgi:hypothetical protein